MKTKKFTQTCKGLVLWAMILSSLLGRIGAQAQDTPSALKQETPEQFQKRMKWWKEAKFGMFIHWGLYSVAAGEWNGKKTGGAGEWIMNDLAIPPGEYEKLLPQFNPVKFNAKQWVSIAKNAGMKYIVITSKHHDGFCLFDSKVGDYTVMRTPFKRDIMKELSNECRKQGIKMCWYHSIMDWHHTLAKGATFPQYAEKMRGQLRELLTNYGPIGVMWFDGEWIGEWTQPQGEALYTELRKIQPSLIINNRISKGREGMAGKTAKGMFGGDFGTPEQEVPATGLPDEEWESCMTMNNTWGFKKDDQNWKSTGQLLHTLVDIASKGGNFLLNVGPTGEGLIPEASVERLAEMGRWMKVNGKSIYGTKPNPFKKLPFDGRCTVKGNSLFVTVFQWPEGDIYLPGVKSPVLEARTLDGGERLHTGNETGILHISKPAKIDPYATVIELRLKGPLVATDTP